MPEVRDIRFQTGRRCPHCRTTEGITQWGSYRGRQRYRCRPCGRTFNDLTGTPFEHAKRWDRLPMAAHVLLSSLSVRKAARRLGVATSTAFRWRHRIMGAIHRLPAEVLAGIIEGDETYFRHSRKGQRGLHDPRKRGTPAPKRGLSREQVAVVTLRDRQSRTVAEVVSRGAPTAQALARVLAPSVPAGSTLCSDGAGGYARFCAGAGVTHRAVGNVPGTRVVGGIYHIQHVNALHRQLKDWMRRFNGVATKYLPNYLRWYVFLDATKDLSRRAARRKLMLDACAA